MGEKHALPRDDKARKSEQEKHGRWGNSTHKLETRRQDKVSKTNMGNRESTHFLEIRKKEKMSKTHMGDGGKARTG
jgi:hypothetical protein